MIQQLVAEQSHPKDATDMSLSAVPVGENEATIVLSPSPFPWLSPSPLPPTLYSLAATLEVSLMELSAYVCWRREQAQPTEGRGEFQARAARVEARAEGGPTWSRAYLQHPSKGLSNTCQRMPCYRVSIGSYSR